MTDWLPFDSYRFATAMAWLGAFLALFNLAAVVTERTTFAFGKFRRRRIEQQYEPFIRRAIDGDRAAQQWLAKRPRRHRFHIARSLITPLYTGRDPDRVSKARAIVDGMALHESIVRWLHSRLPWKRATAVRALGLLQRTEHTPAIVAALDDTNPDVRAAALDAIADLQDPQALKALLVRLHDESLHRGHRFAAVAAFGTACESFVLEMADLDPVNRVDYAQALRICGTPRSLPLLSRWVKDPDPDIRAVAFEALGNIGIDDNLTSLAIRALQHDEVKVRAMAAYALRGPGGSNEVASHLLQHLDDQWPVAIRAAQALKTMGGGGIASLQSAASRSDLAGELARQTLWEISATC